MASWGRKWKVRQVRGQAVLWLSATLGVPPFYPVSVLAGSLRVPFGRFLAIGSGGRFLHYAAVVFGTRLLWPLLD